jgi:hypothetical protein
MKPYFAVLIDSFNEAIASRVLWILFVAWTLILAGIAPFGYVEEKTYELRPQEFKDVNAFMKQLEVARGGKGTASQQRIAGLLPDEAFEAIKTFNSKPEDERRPIRRTTVDKLVTGLNKILENKELYTAEAWPTADKRSNMKDLISKGPASLAADETQELNRRLLESAYTAYVFPANGDGLWLGYAGFKLFDQLPVSRRQANQFVEIFAFTAIIKIGLGVIAVFVAIIITSSLIPDMLQAGSLHLLLSKPISRSLLFLSKFFGGTVFILLNITYLLVGLYLIAGWRFGIWNEGLLAIIPVIGFVFVIFFSVSALTGVIWKNAIVSVVLTILFWLLCFVVGAVRDGFRPWVEQMPQVVNLQELNGELLASTESGQFHVWDATKSNWQGVVSNEFDVGQKIVGPVLLPDSKKLLFVKAGRGGMGFRGARGGLTIADLNEPEDTKDGGKPRDFRWDSDSGPDVPEGTRQILPWRGTMLVLAESGLYKLDPKKLELSESVPTSIMGFSIPKMATVSPFERISPNGWNSQRPDFMTLSKDGTQVWVYHRGEIEKLVWNDKTFESKDTLKVDGERTAIGILAVGQTKGLLVRENEVPKVFDLAKPEALLDVSQAKNDIPRQVWYLGQNDEFVVLYQDGHVGIIDAATLKYSEPNLAGQGSATAVSIAEDGKLWVAYSVRYVSKWDLAANSTLESKVAPRNTAQWIYDFVINPIYMVNPKPAALDETTQYLLQGKETLGISVDTTDVEQSRAKLDPWTPLWTNGLFVAVMLGVACLYFVRQEF